MVTVGTLVFVEKCIREFPGHGLLQRDEIRELGCRPTLSTRVLHLNLHHPLAYFHLRGNCCAVTTPSLGFSCICSIIRCLYSALHAWGPVHGRELFPYSPQANTILMSNSDSVLARLGCLWFGIFMMLIWYLVPPSGIGFEHPWTVQVKVIIPNELPVDICKTKQTLHFFLV